MNIRRSNSIWTRDLLAGRAGDVLLRFIFPAVLVIGGIWMIASGGAIGTPFPPDWRFVFIGLSILFYSCLQIATRTIGMRSKSPSRSGRLAVFAFAWLSLIAMATAITISFL